MEQLESLLTCDFRSAEIFEKRRELTFKICSLIEDGYLNTLSREELINFYYLVRSRISNVLFYHDIKELYYDHTESSSTLNFFRSAFKLLNLILEKLGMCDPQIINLISDLNNVTKPQRLTQKISEALKTFIF